MPSQCQQFRAEYAQLKNLKQEFALKYQQALETGDWHSLKQLKAEKAELERRRDALAEKLWPFENLPQKELLRQYESQRAILQNTGVLEKLPSGELGITAVNNKKYAYPSYQEITKLMRKNKETLKTKIEQGFSQLLIVPFGLKLDDLIEKYRQVILQHHQQGKLLATKEKPIDPDELLELDASQPVWVWDGYNNADASGQLVYFPQEFSQNHQGKTKREILKKQGGFNVLLLEDLPNIPRNGRGREIKGRKQLEAGQKPNDYLKMLKTNPVYRDESGMTPEEQIIYAIKQLEETNQIIDDYSGNGSASYQLEAYFTADGSVPSAGWAGGDRQAVLGRDDPEFSDSDFGGRGAVRVE